MSTYMDPFSLADGYARLLAPDISTVRERRADYPPPFAWSERHLQCIWFDARYRPTRLDLPNGETATVLDPGEWNLEAGPDFLNATLQIDPGARQLRGDVEIHIRPSEWDTHGHGADPAYARVIAHVTWFPGPPPRTLPASACSLTLATPILAQAGFSPDDIDLKAYPHAVLPATPRPCEALLKNAPDRARELLAAAGAYRLQSKAKRFVQRLELSGDPNPVFYEEFMAALGYKNNAAPFRRLARLLPVATLANLPREAAFARLLGTAGLLPQPDRAPDPEGQTLIRRLWDIWWREASDNTPAEPFGWRLHGLRPQNTPVRRLAAAACLFGGDGGLLSHLETFAASDARTGFRQLTDLFDIRCRWPFWNTRLAFSSHPDATQNTALLGPSRTAALLTNVVIPFLAAENKWPADITDYLPPEDLSTPMRLTARHLFGRDHNPALYTENGLLQQGLLQIHLDFCLNAKPGCETCAIRQALEKAVASR